VPIRVGVILDLATALGKKSLLSLEMTLEDFYAAHPVRDKLQIVVDPND
jgi:ionotropic glutamate receptor